MVKPRREQLTNTPINTEFSKGLVFDEQNPGFGAGHVSAGKGIIWIDNTFSPSRLMFTDESGTDHDITSGGGGSLAATLVLGKTTGTNAYTTGNDIVLSSGDSIKTANGQNPGDAGITLNVLAGDGNTNNRGGDVIIASGTGGATIGAGGGIGINSGNAVANGDGGGGAINSGNGGSVTGNGGDWSIITGAAPTIGDGGLFSVYTGTGGATSGNGGDVLLSTGDGPTGHDGYIQLKLGTSGATNGVIDFLAGPNSFIKHQPNGITNVYLASAPATIVEYSASLIEVRQADQITNSNTGLYLHAANATSGSSGTAGGVLIAGGKSDGYVDGGLVGMVGGPGGTTSGNGGQVVLEGGPAATAIGSQQGVVIVGGGQDTGTGASIALESSSAGVGSGLNGGNIVLETGNADGYGQAGSVTIFTGQTATTPTALGSTIIANGANGIGTVYPEGGVPVGGTINLNAGNNAYGSSGAIASLSGAGNIGGGPILLIAGDGVNSGGLINIVSGSVLGPETTSTSNPSGGDINIAAGSITYTDSRRSGGGNIFINSGHNVSTAPANSGQIEITTGDCPNDFVGNLLLATGSGNNGGSMLLTTGNITGFGADISILTGIAYSGFIKLQTGASLDGNSSISLLCGDSTGFANGSNIVLTSGAGTNAFNGGNIAITGGSGGSGGATGDGGNITITGGQSFATIGFGGSIDISSGQGTQSSGFINILTVPSTVAGDITIQCGASITGNGAAMTIQAGNAGSGNSDGGGITILTGAGSSVLSGNGGQLTLQAASGGVGATGNGGVINIISGGALGTDGYGGDITINAGGGQGVGDGGDIILTPGAAPGTGINGVVKLQDCFNVTKFEINNTGIGFYATPPIAKPTITGAKGGNAALASLLTELANLGLITDSTT